MINYLSSLRNAWRATRKNKSLLVAYILQTIANLILFAVIFIPQMPYLLESLNTSTPIPTIANKTLLLFMLFCVIDIAIMLVFNAWFKAGIMGMLNAVIENKKPTTKEFFIAANSLYKAFLAYQIVRFALVFLTALPLTIFVYFYVITKSTIFIIPIIAAFFLFLLGWLLLSASLFFAIPGVVREKLNAMTAINKSFSLFKKKRSHVIKSFLIYFALIILTLVLTFAALPLTSWLETIGADNSWRYIVAATQFIIITLVTIVATIFMLEMYRKSI